MSLSSTSRVKTALGIPAGVTFHDAAILAAVNYANDVVLKALGQPGGLVATTRTDYPNVYTSVQQDILLDRTPVVSIIAVTNYSSAVAAADYRVDLETGMMRLNRGTVDSRVGLLASWSDVPDGVVISYLHGYTDGNVPERYRRCADLIAAHNTEKIRHEGKTKVRNSSYGFTVDQMVIPPAASWILGEIEDAFHT